MRASKTAWIVSSCVVALVGCASKLVDIPTSDRPVTLRSPCEDSVEAVYTEPMGLEAYDASHRGEVVHCAVDRTLSVKQIEEALADAHVVDAEVNSAVRGFRIMYRTDRLLGHEGLTGALLLLPDPLIRVGAPLLVFGHGGVGDSPDGAFSKSDPTRSDSINRVDAVAALTLASRGFPLIAPDYPGFIEGGTPGNFIAEDEAHSLLDATRAFENLVTKSGMSDKVVLVGHSQGGHAILAAQALAGSYGLVGRLSAVVPLAPSWIAARSHAAYLSKALAYNTTDNAIAIATSMTYLNSLAELYDGPGAGANLYQRSADERFAKWFAQPDPFAALPILGRTPYDFFEPAFLDVVATCAVSGASEDCSSDLAKTWLKRFRADRPALDARGADILVWQAAHDVLVPTGEGRCAIEKMMSDLTVDGATALYTACGDRDADHNDVVTRNVSWVAAWIAHHSLGMPAPEACPGQEALELDGKALECPDPPGNKD